MELARRRSPTSSEGTHLLDFFFSAKYLAIYFIFIFTGTLGRIGARGRCFSFSTRLEELSKRQDGSLPDQLSSRSNSGQGERRRRGSPQLDRVHRSRARVRSSQVSLRVSVHSGRQSGRYLDGGKGARRRWRRTVVAVGERSLSETGCWWLYPLPIGDCSALASSSPAALLFLSRGRRGVAASGARP